MRKCILFFIVTLIATSLIACGTDYADYSPIEVTESDFSFHLPDGYSFSNHTTTSISIMKDEQIIGGITNTCLPAAAFEEENQLSLSRYFDSVYPTPLMPEWFAWHGDNALIMTLSITNTETNERIETARRIFIHNDLLYDLWVDNSMINEDVADSIFQAILSK